MTTTIIQFVAANSIYVAIFLLGYSTGAMMMMFGFWRHQRLAQNKPFK